MLAEVRNSYLHIPVMWDHWQMSGKNIEKFENWGYRQLTTNSCCTCHTFPPATTEVVEGATSRGPWAHPQPEVFPSCLNQNNFQTLTDSESRRRLSIRWHLNFLTQNAPTSNNKPTPESLYPTTIGRYLVHVLAHGKPTNTRHRRERHAVLSRSSPHSSENSQFL